MCLYPAHLATTAPQDEKLVIFPRLLVTSRTAVGIFHFPDKKCLQFNNTAASSDACHQPPPLSAQNTSPLSIFLGDTRHKINKTRCNIQHTGEHTLQLADACLVANDYETGSEAHNNSTHGELLV